VKAYCDAEGAVEVGRKLFIWVAERRVLPVADEASAGTVAPADNLGSGSLLRFSVEGKLVDVARDAREFQNVNLFCLDADRISVQAIAAYDDPILSVLPHAFHAGPFR
jgi:hypothetical protein